MGIEYYNDNHGFYQVSSEDWFDMNVEMDLPEGWVKVKMSEKDSAMMAVCWLAKFKA